ncbi:hypothetical protein RYX36_030248, partial [Vicia faba]
SLICLAKSVWVLADMEEPVGQILKRIELADDLVLEKILCPLGVLLIIFESLRKAYDFISNMGVQPTGSVWSTLLAACRAHKSVELAEKVIIASVMPDTVSGKLIGLVTSRDEIPDLLKLDDVIDLVVPRGSNKLVSQIKESTRIPVLGHADGICHIYVDKSANIDMAKHIVRDAKIDYPAACNALETLLVHKDLSSNGGLNELILELQREGGTILFWFVFFLSFEVGFLFGQITGDIEAVKNSLRQLSKPKGEAPQSSTK